MYFKKKLKPSSYCFPYLYMFFSLSFHVEGSVPHWLWQAGRVPSEINVQLSVGTLG